MPVLKYLADTNALSDLLGEEAPVQQWFLDHPGEIGISSLTLAEMRRGIELKEDGKVRRQLERMYDFVLEDFKGAILVFDEEAAMEWGRLMAEAKNRPLAFTDSLIAAVARSVGLKILTRNIRDFPCCDRINPWTGTAYGAWPTR